MVKQNQIIIDKLSNAEKYFNLHPDFEAAFEYLKKPGLRSLSLGKHEINGNKLFCIVSKNIGSKPDEVKLEAHQKYIDIQYIIEGTDQMGWKRLSDCERVFAGYDASKDVQLFKDKPEVWQKVKAGSFAIFFPEDAHAPSISDKEIHKIVFKIAVE